MNAESQPEPNNHHSRPFSAYSIHYIEIEACESNEFPISYPWESYLEPESHSLNTMVVFRELEIGYCHSGSGILMVEEQVIPFNAGCVSIVGNRAIRMSRSQLGTPSFWSWIWIDHHRLLAAMPDGAELVRENPFASPEFPCIFPPQKYRSLCHAVRRIIAELKGREYGHRTVVKGLACAFLASLFRLCRDMEPGPEQPTHPGVGRIAPALQYMTNHYAEDIDVQDLADLCNVSLTHFRRLFLAAVGKPPLQHLAQLRVRMAGAILAESDRPISQVAYEVGFESINTFNRQFRAIFGVSPRQWRAEHE